MKPAIVLVAAGLIPSHASAQLGSIEAVWRQGAQLEPALPVPARPPAKAGEERVPPDLLKRLDAIHADAVRLRERHEPLRRALMELERLKGPYAGADAAGRAAREPELAKLVAGLRGLMPEQAEIAKKLNTAIGDLQGRLKPPVPHNALAEKLLSAAHDQVHAAYKIKAPAEIPQLGGKPHPLAKWADYLPDRVEIAFDQILEIGVSDALKAGIEEGKKRVRAYNSAMREMHEALHKLQHSLEEHDHDHDHGHDHGKGPGR